jgi:hypothetical protein
MKIGIITFHWATNYGAVLQAYALQTYLLQHGYDTQIIDYLPYTFKKNLIKCLITKRPWRIPGKILDYLKELQFREFRKKHFRLSQKYQSFEDLKMNPPLYDVYICGSDQIWNPNFTLRGERKLTLSYFLDFCPNNVKRIAYAVSFGCTQYPENLLKFLSPILSKFYAMSVRENSGCQLVHKMGIDDVGLMPDPTLLLRAKDYETLIQTSRKIQKKYSFYYALHDSQETIKEIKKYFRRLNHNIIDVGSPVNSMIGVKTWLAFIKSSDVVVTNSYHGMIFSILFRKPFIVVLAEGRYEEMNDRIFTLLGKLGLQDRCVDRCDENKINYILAQAIDWEMVENRLESLRNDAWLFFEKNLK